jgi:UDP-N-acetylglucosamine 2-epimerase (non-hydrolysing)
MSKRNLEMENIKSKNIFVTGNTVIDALFNTIERFDKDYLLGNNKKISLKNKFILVTVHRRENFGEPLKNICLAIKELVQKEKIEAEIIIPVHLNPNVRGIVFALLRNIPNIHLVDPLNYPVFCNLMAKSYLILTDSGGIQEEAPSLGKPVLVLRENTERPEGVNAGTVRIVGRKKENIIKEVKNLIENKKAYIKMSKAKNPYGDGHSSERIIKTILRFLND